MSTLQEIILPPGLAAARPAPSSEGRLYFSTDTGALERDTGAAWEAYADVGGVAGLWQSCCVVVDQKAQNTQGGAFTQGAWRTRDINTEQTDPDGIVTIAANQFTLDVGTYMCIAYAPAHRCNRHQARLYNTTGVALLLTGSSSYESSATGDTTNYTKIVGRFTVAAAQVLEIQHQCQTTRAADGLGVAANITDEIYTQALFLLEN